MQIKYSITLPEREDWMTLPGKINEALGLKNHPVDMEFIEETEKVEEKV